MIVKQSCAAGMLMVAASLSACASKPVVTASPKPTVVPATPRPTPPNGTASNLVIPPVGADGSYATINRGIGADETVWHLRSALNVAALNCRGTQGLAIVAGYTDLLDNQRKPLKAAYAASAKAQSSAAKFDAHVTRVYNFFAQPPAQQDFCRIAQTVVVEANATSPADFKSFAARALPRLETPFTDFYRRYDDYRRDLAAWAARNSAGAPQTQLAAATPAPARRAAAPIAPAVAVAGWRVQLGAFSSEESALSSWTEVRGRISALSDLEPRLEKVPAKQLVRLQAGPLRDKAAANSVCATAIAAGQNCLPVAPTL